MSQRSPLHSPDLSLIKRIDDLMFVLCVTLSIALIWSVPLFPTQDGPLIRSAVAMMQQLLNPNCTETARLFEFNPTPVPNSFSHLIMYVLALMMPLVTAEKCLLSLYVVLFTTGVRAFLGTLRIIPRGSIAVVFVLNGYLLYGFYNFLFSLALAFWFLTLLHKRKKNTLQWGALVCLNIALYFSHLFGWILSGVILASHLFTLPFLRVWKRKTLPISYIKILFKRMAIYAFIFLPSLGLFLVYSASQKISIPTYFNEIFLVNFLIWAVLKYNALLDSYSFKTYSYDLHLTFFILLFCIFSTLRTNRFSTVHAKWNGCLVLLILLFILAPHGMMGGWMAYERIAFILTFVCIVFMVYRLSLRSQAFVMAACIGLWGFLAISFYQGAASYQPLLEEFKTVDSMIPENTSYLYKDLSKGDAPISGFKKPFVTNFEIVEHMGNSWMEENGRCRVNQLQYQANEFGVFPIRVKPEYGLNFTAQKGLYKRNNDVLLEWLASDDPHILQRLPERFVLYGTRAEATTKWKILTKHYHYTQSSPGGHIHFYLRNAKD